MAHIARPATIASQPHTPLSPGAPCASLTSLPLCPRSSLSTPHMHTRQPRISRSASFVVSSACHNSAQKAADRSTVSILGQLGNGRAGVTTRSRSLQNERSTSATLRSVSEATSALPDIDAADRDDPLQAAEYINDILAWYRKAEAREVISATYMKDQNDVNEKMRAILIDWLVEVHLKFKLMPETLHLTVNVIDRFLAKKQVTRKNLQLVGVTAMLVASKYEEIWAPEVRDFVYISDKAYSRDQILNTEKMMLNTLKFNMTVPTAYHFMNRFLKAAKADKRMEQTAFYLLELAMPNYDFVKYPSSLMAASALRAAQLTLQRGSWNTARQKHSQYSEAQMSECIQNIVSEQAKAPNSSLHAVTKKYSSSKYGEVAKLPAPILN